MDKIDVAGIAKLAQEARGFEIKSVSLTGAPGLPSSIPLGFDNRPESDDCNSGKGVVDLKKYFESFRLYPERRKGTANVSTLAAFIDLTNRHKTQHSAIFAATSWPNPALTAVLDYHELVNLTGNAQQGVESKPDAKPQFCEHRINYAFPLTDEFKMWADGNGQWMKQGEFAAFIEERIADLAQATTEEEREFGQLFQTKIANPAEMFALSRGLDVNVAGRVTNNVRLSSGEGEVVFTEEHKDSKGQKITVPGLFMVCVPPFLDSQAVRLPARLRYRVSDGSITWAYQLYRWKELLRERVVNDLNTAEEHTALPTYEGAPER